MFAAPGRTSLAAALRGLSTLPRMPSHRARAPVPLTNEDAFPMRYCR